jgi:hypothetical protein
MTLEEQAKAQEQAALHARSIDMNYLAHQHEELARRLRAAAEAEAAQSTGRAEAS